MHGAFAHTVESHRGAPVVLNARCDTPVASSADSLILAIATHRDREAFAALFNHFAPRVKSYLMRMGAAPAQAEELAQEALVTVWRKAELFDPARASASTWIFRIARNLRLDDLRRARSAASFEPDPTDTAADPETPEGAMLMRQRDDRLRKGLTALTADQLRVLQLSFFQDCPHAEIAEALGLPLGTVKSRIRLAIQRLRDALEVEP